MPVEPRELRQSHQNQQRDLILLLMKTVGSCHSDKHVANTGEDCLSHPRIGCLAEDIDTKHIEHYLPQLRDQMWRCALDVSHHQNAYSSTLPVKGVVWGYETYHHRILGQMEPFLVISSAFKMRPQCGRVPSAGLHDHLVDQSHARSAAHQRTVQTADRGRRSVPGDVVHSESTTGMCDSESESLVIPALTGISLVPFSTLRRAVAASQIVAFTTIIRSPLQSSTRVLHTNRHGGFHNHNP
jgi:hypothetical protein